MDVFCARFQVREEGKQVFGECRTPGDDSADGLDQFSRSPLPNREVCVSLFSVPCKFFVW